jgi:predicted phage terminase large subunit-like protein
LSYSAVGLVVTRLAQQCYEYVNGEQGKLLTPRLYFDCNPPNKLHWTYLLFVKFVDPETKEPLKNPEKYKSIKMNPADNKVNLTETYLETLASLPARLRKRFIDGDFADANPDGLFNDETIEKWRVLDGRVPEFVRVVVACDPSGSDDTDNAGNDAIGIAVVGLGVDGNVYLLEDCTVKAGPAVWGRIVTTAYDRHKADVVVGEMNFGGAMVKFVIQTSRPGTPFMPVTASRGKAVRAEPVSALYEEGKVRHVGYFRELEEELSGFSSMGYVGEHSPNRADALIWAITALFPGATKKQNNVNQKLALPVVNHYG